MSVYYGSKYSLADVLKTVQEVEGLEDPDGRAPT